MNDRRRDIDCTSHSSSGLDVIAFVLNSFGMQRVRIEFKYIPAPAATGVL